MTTAALLLGAGNSWADGPKPESSMSNPFVLLMVVIILFLGLIIAILARLVLGAAFLKTEREKKERQTKSTQGPLTAAVTTTLLLFLSVSSFAQDKVPDAAAASSTISGLAPTAYYAITGVAFLEIIVIIALLMMLRSFLGIERKAMLLAASGAAAGVPQESWWDKFNKFKPLQQEATIDLGHNYDGIRELDNRLPPWWLYGFYITILFAAIYLYRYHVAHSAPLPREQYELDVAAADKAKAEYLKKAANNVDESTVKLLSDPTSLSAGKQIFETSCFPCHGKFGEGLVGPNLTDDYWLHGGSVNDIFKTIKYGYPEKGMKSWKDDFSPVQIAQLASFIKSLHGTNPPNGKAPQGVLYQGDGGKTDSTKKDNTTTAMNDTKK